MNVSNLFRREGLWWLGIPFITGFLTWFPYIILNTWNHVGWSKWRVPFVPIVLFDSSAYFEWIGPALSGYPAGDHIGLFVWVFRLLGVALPSSLQIAEVWLVSLWVTVTIGIWIMASTIRAWSDLERGSARALACCASLSVVVPFMGRPGVFTWYAPFYVLALATVWRTHRCLGEHRPLAAGLWALVSLGAAWVYPYFFLHILLWLIVMIFVHLWKRSVALIGAAGIMITPLIIGLIVPFLMAKPSAHLALELQERMGLAFTRWPVVSNSLLLVLLWSVFLAIVARFIIKKPLLQERLCMLLMGWVTLVGAWLSNVFTGVYIHNDHFRGPAALLAWVSLACIYGVTRQEEKTPVSIPNLEQVRNTQGAYSLIVTGVLGISSACLAWYVLIKKFVFTGDYLNIVHASHWLTLIGAATLMLAHPQKKWQRTVWGSVLLLSVGLGVSARLHIFQKEAKTFHAYIPYVSVNDWIREHTSPREDVCADARTGEVIGSFSGRMVHPSFAAIALPKPDEEIMQQLKTQLGYYNANMAEPGTALAFTVDSMRGTTCTQFAFWSRVAAMMGRSQTAFRETTGCPDERINENKESMNRYLLSRKKNETLFRLLCPVVIVSSEHRSLWELPEGYQETKINEQFSAWKSP